MTHLTEEELIEYHYNEERSPELERHLAACPACAAASAALRDDLAAFSNFPVPQRDSRYAEQTWESLRRSLTPHPKSRRPWFQLNLPRALTFASVVAAVLLAVFFAGRQWEAKHHPPTVALHSDAADPQSRERVIILVLGDHLDRSERLLVELSHPDQAAGDSSLQTTARELLSENRLYRQTAGHTLGTDGKPDKSLNGTLEDLEQLLVEVANNPNALSRPEIQQLQREMNTGALLVEVRVLRTRIQQQQTSEIGNRAGSV